MNFSVRSTCPATNPLFSHRVSIMWRGKLRVRYWVLFSSCHWNTSVTVRTSWKSFNLYYFSLARVTLSHHHHHHMALQPNPGPGLPCWCFITITFLQGWIVTPAPNPQPGGPGLRILTPGDRVAQLYPQALGNHFSRLLRHAWVTVYCLIPATTRDVT
jgi:hypothetical protein